MKNEIAQPGATANDHVYHDSCLRRTRARLGCGRSITLGKESMLFPSESLEAAGYLFEQAHGRVLAPSEISVVEDAGFSSALTHDVADTIWSTLAASSLPSDYRTSAYWALGKLARKEDKKRFIGALRLEVQTDIRVAYQVLIALENVGEAVFSRDGVSFDEDELNRRDALAYLSAHT